MQQQQQQQEKQKQQIEFPQSAEQDSDWLATGDDAMQTGGEPLSPLIARRSPCSPCLSVKSSASCSSSSSSSSSSSPSSSSISSKSSSSSIRCAPMMSDSAQNQNQDASSSLAPPTTGSSSQQVLAPSAFVAPNSATSTCDLVSAIQNHLKSAVAAATAAAAAAAAAVAVSSAANLTPQPLVSAAGAGQTNALPAIDSSPLRLAQRNHHLFSLQRLLSDDSSCSSLDDPYDETHSHQLDIGEEGASLDGQESHPLDLKVLPLKLWHHQASSASQLVKVFDSHNSEQNSLVEVDTPKSSLLSKQPQLSQHQHTQNHQNQNQNSALQQQQPPPPPPPPLTAMAATTTTTTTTAPMLGPLGRQNTSTNTGQSNNGKQRRLYKCRHCAFETYQKVENWQHARNHIRPEKLLCCEFCDFVTEYKHHLEYHQRNHSGHKPFKCDNCDYRCVNKSMLNSHMKSHSSVYQYQCGDCKYATKYVHSLKMHLRKYNHQPTQMVIDVYGRRRGPRSTSSSSGSASNGASGNGTQKPNDKPNSNKSGNGSASTIVQAKVKLNSAPPSAADGPMEVQSSQCSVLDLRVNSKLVR